MKSSCAALFLSIVLIAGLETSATADEHPWQLGVSIGTTTNTPDFDLYGITGHRALPWVWPITSGWQFTSTVNWTLATLRSGGESGALVGAGPGVRIEHPDKPWSLDLGFDVAYISEDHYPSKDLGGNLQFVSHISLHYRFDPRWRIGYRYQHLSNADLEEPNPGLDHHILEIVATF